MSIAAPIPWLADGLVLLGCLVMTLGVVGILRMRTVYGKLHAASKSVFLGVCAILVGAITLGDAAVGARAALIFVLLLLTTPVAAHEIAKATWREDQLGSGAEKGADSRRIRPQG